MIIKKRFLKIEEVILTTLFIFSVCLIFIPITSFKLGNFFFGQNKFFYNIDLAQKFYTFSSYPISPLPAPNYAHHQLSRTYFIQGDLGTALKEAKKELELYPKNTFTYYILGLTYGYMNREEEGIDAFSKYIEHHPTTWAARNDKAWLQFRIGDFYGAIQTLEPLADTQPGNIWIQNSYCALMISVKRYKEAEESCNKAELALNQIDEETWGVAYPGNDPRIYSLGFTATKKSISENLKIINEAK
jgi:tetratricopeptide (TPR) repeat protein